MGQQTGWKKRLKDTGYLGLIAVFGLMATGCSSKPDTTAKTYQVRVWRLDQDIDSFRDLIDEFQKAHPSTTVTYSKKNIDGYEFSALKSLAGRLGPDIWSIPSDWMGDYQDQVLPLPDNFFQEDGQTTTPKPVDAIKAAFPIGIAEQVISADGTKAFGIPSNVDTLKLYVNSTILDDALQEYRKAQGENLRDDVFQPIRQLLINPPTTWNDLIEQTKYVTLRNGNTITRSTIALGTADNIPNSQDILELLIMQNGSKILSDDHKSPLFHIAQGTPSGGQVRPGEKALEFFTSFSDPTKATYSWNPSMPQALDAFGQGKVAMVIAYSDFGKQLKVKYPKFSFDVVKTPQISAAQEQVNLTRFSIETVTKTADNPTAAFAFMKTYIGESNMRQITREQKLYPPYTTTLKQAAEDDEFANQILNATTVWKLNHSQFDAVFRQMIIDSSQNSISPADSIKAGGDKIDSLLNPKPSTN